MTSFSQVNQPGSSDYRAGWQRQHVIPQEIFDDPALNTFLETMELIGLNEDDFDTNGILLPSTEVDAIASGFSTHRGSHPKYTQFVKKVIRGISTEFTSDLASGDADEAERRALANIRGLQAFLIDAQTVQAEFDGVSGITYGKPLFALNRPGLIQPGAPKEDLDEALQSIYDEWSFENIQETTAFKEGKDGAFSAFFARAGSIYDAYMLIAAEK